MWLARGVERLLKKFYESSFKAYAACKKHASFVSLRRDVLSIVVKCCQKNLAAFHTALRCAVFERIAPFYFNMQVCLHCLHSPNRKSKQI